MSSILFLFGLCVAVTQLQGLNGIEFENSIEFAEQMSVASFMLLVFLTLGIPRIIGMHNMELFTNREPKWSRMSEPQTLPNFTKIFATKSTLKLENMEKWSKIGAIAIVCLVSLVGAFTKFRVEVHEYDFYNKSDSSGGISYLGAVTQEKEFSASNFYLTLDFENSTNTQISELLSSSESQLTLRNIRNILEKSNSYYDDFWLFDFIDWVMFLDQKTEKKRLNIANEAILNKYWSKTNKYGFNHANLDSKDYNFLLSFGFALKSERLLVDKLVNSEFFVSLLSHWIWLNRARVTLSAPFVTEMPEMPSDEIHYPDTRCSGDTLECHLENFVAGTSEVDLKQLRIPFGISSFDQNVTLNIIDQLEAAGVNGVKPVVTSHTLEKMHLLELLDFPNVVKSRVFVIGAIILLATSVVHMNLKITIFTVSLFRQLGDLPG